MNIIKVKGLSCQHCIAAVKEEIEEVPGITKVEVTLTTVTWYGDAEESAVRAAIIEAGYEPV